jgi:hypothetical protein
MSGDFKKIACKVRPAGPDGKLLSGHDALAYMMACKVDDSFTAHFGSIEVACGDSGVAELLNASNLGRVCLDLEDGRLVEVKLLGGRGSKMVSIQGQVFGQDYLQLYFVAISSLGS